MSKKASVKKHKVDVSKEDIYLKGDSLENMISPEISHINCIRSEKSNKHWRSIFNDRMFKAMFCNAGRKEYAARFLSYFVDVSYEEILKNMEFYKEEFDMEKEGDKNSRGDFVVKLGNTLINIEVNNNCELERNLDYMDRLSKICVKSGEPYEYYRVISINLNNFERNGVGTYDVNRRTNTCGKMVIYKVSLDIYVPKIKEKMYNEGVKNLSSLERDIMVMSLTNESVAKELAKGDEMMEKYAKETEFVLSDDLLESYDHFQDMVDGEVAYQMEVFKIKMEAERNAEREKLKAEKFETAKSLFQDGMSLEKIIEHFKFTAKDLEKFKLML